MSNSLAIATVTATLHHMLYRALPSSGVTGATVTNLQLNDAKLPDSGINIFLFQVTPNASLRNADLPTRRADGSLLRRPQVALDLHYLLTFYGTDATFDQHRLIGAAACQLHAHPVLWREAIRETIAHHPVLHDSNLAEQIDVVRLTLASLSLEELSKLWVMFPDVDYVLSMIYIASVVLIETDDAPPGPALRVRRPGLTVVPFSLASIDSVKPYAVDWSPSPPTPITLIGSNLSPADEVTFTTPDTEMPLVGTVQSAVDDTQLTVLLPAGLRAGINTVRLTQVAPASASYSSAAPRLLAQSNAAPFILRPTVSLTLGSPLGTITAVVSPPVGPQQQVVLLLNQISTPASASSPAGARPPSFALPAVPLTAETNTVVFDYTGFSGSGIPAGTYLARVRVDEAESRLETNAAGTYSGPVVTIP
jgi:hypothetical protein